MIDISKTVLICPRNDEESLMILMIAEKLGLATVISGQPHGAKLDREKNLLARVMDENPEAQTLVIVELPGIGAEKELEEQGLNVIIIDHHRYDDLDRMRDKSSLEQFIDLFNVTDAMLSDFGFDSDMVRGVGVIDRGFLWELPKAGYNGEKRRKVIEYYRKLTLELGQDRRAREEEAAQVAWESREERDGVIIIHSDEDKSSIRDAISFIIAKEFEKPTPAIIIQGKRRMYVQDSDSAKDLHEKFGGFTFGHDRCWGILTDEEPLPNLDEVLEIVVQ
ncbi:MAG: hypothetical protein Q8P30_02125 [Candidatus Uhrbacteria bacterium]|nr:hypothetical protein [Candidatus Uhrbacteria bacterium]